ncbi:mannitol dehydrogenase family protein [Sphingomonas sp. Leaf25]|uniref:mannitol dehydrogenase family protein n=1 Tax=Sphingomonas sp. Leaf25 TaxID=1735692 RepID=UPI0006F1EB98|nr:mannitol dehydrogenase family protein [Sphingomonas sp. Leaf25]KQN06973.1 mannitol dehydrogenase [Sphingomonas sp. Leaf25]
MSRLPATVARYDYDRAAQRIGIVHLGIGAFTRAHQAVFTDRAMAAGDRDWAIVGAPLRSSAVRDALVRQDGLFTVTETGADGARSRLIGSVRDVIVASDPNDDLHRALVSPDVAIVTMTVTEKGYHRRADGSLDVAAVERSPGTLYHHLARAFAGRRDAGLGGLSLLSCDNLADNGGVLAASLGIWLDHVDPSLGRWFEGECTCPSTMVDRIVPAITLADLDRTEDMLGLRDEAAVLTEPFAQWVIEDRFAGRRPRWDAAGAQIVTDVAPYETAKLRMLNGAHSALAYLGLRAGLTYVHEAIADAAIGPIVERLMRNEAAAGLDAAPGQNLSAYADALLARFANPTLRHALRQIATDGSQKIAQRWLASLDANGVQGRTCPETLKALAAWMLHVRGDNGPVDDPRAAEFAAAWAAAGRDGIIGAMVGDHGLLAGTWHPRACDRALLAENLATFDT